MPKSSRISINLIYFKGQHSGIYQRYYVQLVVMLLMRSVLCPVSSVLCLQCVFNKALSYPNLHKLSGL